MEFRILGPVEAIEHGRSLPLGAHKQRALLTLLLLHNGEVVSAERLIDELWSGEPPQAAAKSLQVYVSQLRKALGNGVLETRGRGYVLEVAPEQLDAQRFERLLERGRELLAAGDPQAATTTLHDALGLWRGPPLDDVAYEGFAQPEIARLEELRQAALEERADAELALGRHAELLPELESLVRQYPLRERLRAQLMQSLYRSGRQTEALAAYEEGRRALDEEFGLEPSRELQDLQRAILEQDPQLDAPARAAPAMARRSRRRALVIAVIGACLLAAAAAAAAVAIGLTRDGGDEQRVVSVGRNSVAVIDPRTNRVLDSIRVGDGPSSIAVANGRVWVVNRDAQTISVIDASTRALVKTFAIGATPTDIAAGPGGIWVGDSATHSVLELDPDTGAVVRTISAPPLTPPSIRPGVPLGGAVAADGETVWFASGHATLTRIDPGTGAVQARIREGGPVLDAPHLAVGEGAVWVSACCGVVTRVDPRTNSVAASIPVPADGPIAAGLGSVWLADTATGLLWQLDPDSLVSPNLPVKTIAVARAPLDVMIGAGSVWVAGGEGTVSRVDPRGEVQTIRVEGSLSGIAFGEGAVWVAVN